MTVDEIRLALPAVPEYARIARLTVAGLATRIGFTYDEIEDLRIAVGEACSILLGDTGRTGTLTLTYEVAADEISVAATGDFADHEAPDEDTLALSAQILDAVVDEHELSTDHTRVRLRKRRGDVR
ncbi:hypothetical protein BH20ACT2_BH20ACT2_13050 [soil metagenome]